MLMGHTSQQRQTERAAPLNPSETFRQAAASCISMRVQRKSAAQSRLSASAANFPEPVIHSCRSE